MKKRKNEPYEIILKSKQLLFIFLSLFQCLPEQLEIIDTRILLQKHRT